MDDPIPPDANGDPNQRTPQEQEEWERFIRSLAGSISPEDLATIRHVIEEGCEQIDYDGWEFRL